MDVTLIIPVLPVGKGRPKAYRKPGGHVGIYTPEKTRTFEATVAELAASQLPASAIEGPVRVDILVVFRRISNLNARRHPDGLVTHGKKPDLDNVVKAVLDGLATAWNDDAQVARIDAGKAYAERHGRARVVVRIRTIEPESVSQWAASLGLLARG